MAASIQILRLVGATALDKRISILRLVGATALDKRISILRLVGTTDLNKQIAILRLTGKTVSNPNNIYVQTPAGLRRGHLCYYDGTTIYKAV